MNSCKYNIDVKSLEAMRFDQGLPLYKFRLQFITETGNPIAYTTYCSLVRRGMCTASVMLAIKKIYPEVVIK